MSQKVVVVGAGVSGLSCALALLEGGDDVEVEILAERIGTESLSRVAAALFYPYFAEHPHLERWITDGVAWFGALADAGEGGVRWTTGAELHGVVTPDATWGSLLREYRHRAPRRDDRLPERFVDLHEFVTPVVEIPLYLPYLVGRIERAGGRIRRRSIASLDEVTGDDVVVVHASGVHARRLVPDDRVAPSLGQVVRVAGADLERVLLDEEDLEHPTYLVPRSADCVVGSVDRPWPVDELGYEPPPPDPNVTREILARAGELWPGLANAVVVDAECGLRPRRDVVRVEIDEERLRAGRRVVHDYGHGGAGVTLSWGCALEVRELVRALSNPPT